MQQLSSAQPVFARQPLKTIQLNQNLPCAGFVLFGLMTSENKCIKSKSD
jgi:hypothetical protein